MNSRERTDRFPFDDFPKHDMLSIQVRRRHRRDEKLRPVGVRPSIRHRQQERFRMVHGEGLVLKLFTINRLAARPISGGKVTYIHHAISQARLQRSEITHRPGS